MAKIVVRLPEPKEEYDVSNQKQINRAIALITEQLNSTFLNEQKQEQERFSWFIGINIYKNAKLDLTTASETVLYTVPSDSRAIWGSLYLRVMTKISSGANLDIHQQMHLVMHLLYLKQKS